MKTLHELFRDELGLLLSAAGYMHDIFKRMSSTATAPQVRQLLDTYYFQAQYQIKQIQEHLGLPSLDKNTCRSFAMRRLADEARTNLSYEGSSEIRDIVLLFTAHRIKHYGITSIGTAAHHAELLKSDEGTELLDTIRKKVAEKEQQELELIEHLTKKNKSSEFKNEVEQLLSRIVATQVTEEDKLDLFLKGIIEAASSKPVKDALKTYHEKHLGIKQYLSTLRSNLPSVDRFEEWEALEDFIEECKSQAEKSKEKNLRDVVIISNIQKIMHLNIASFHVEELLAGFLKKKELKDRLYAILEHEWGNDQSFTSIATGSLLAEGIENKIQK